MNKLHWIDEDYAGEFKMPSHTEKPFYRVEAKQDNTIVSFPAKYSLDAVKDDLLSRQIEPANAEFNEWYIVKFNPTILVTVELIY